MWFSYGRGLQPAAAGGAQGRPGVMPGAPMMKSPEEIRQLEQLAKQSPKNAEAWIMLGNALMDSNRFSEAAEPTARRWSWIPRT